MAAYLLIGEAPNAEFAARLADQYKGCPHVHFVAAFGTMLVAVWYVPESKRWWLELVAEHPQISLGLLRAAVYRTERASYPEVALREPTPCVGPLAPCGSDCRACARASNTAVRGVSSCASSAAVRGVSSCASSAGEATQDEAGCDGCPALATSNGRAAPVH